MTLSLTPILNLNRQNKNDMSDEAMNNFTPRAQQVLALARKEADRFNHNFVGTEHLLLGLIKLGQGVAVNVLQKLGLDLETVRLEVEKQVGTGPDQKMIGNIPYTPRVKKVLSLAAKEAKGLNHTYVGTEHILWDLSRGRWGRCEGFEESSMLTLNRRVLRSSRSWILILRERSWLEKAGIRGQAGDVKTPALKALAVTSLKSPRR